jgi:hypothetical protein
MPPSIRNPPHLHSREVWYMFGALHQKEMTGFKNRLRRSMFLTISYINSRLNFKPVHPYR